MGRDIFRGSDSNVCLPPVHGAASFRTTRPADLIVENIFPVGRSAGETR